MSELTKASPEGRSETELDRWLLELGHGPADAADLEDPQRAEALADRDQFLDDVFPRTLENVLARTREAETTPWWSRGLARWFGAAGVAAAAAALAFIMIPHPHDGGLRTGTAVNSDQAGLAEVRARGAAAVRVVGIRDGVSFSPDAAHPAREGDALRFLPMADGHDFVSLFGLTAGAPPAPALRHTAASLELPAGGAALPGSYVLDGAAGPERLLAVFSREPLDDAAARAIARRAAAGESVRDGSWEAIELRVPKLGGGAVTSRRTLIAVAAATFAWAAAPPAGASEPLRYALVVGHNDGGPGRTQLRYAEQEAAELSTVLQQVGEVAADRVVLLQAPGRSDVLAALDQIEARAGREAKDTGRDTLLLVYFSGHADGQHLELGSEVLAFAEIRERLESFDATVRVGLIDTCMSGAIMRTKGGRPGPSYAITLTDRLRASGVALLASSGPDELAQEADDIGGSYFTRALVAGLRGAADRDADLRVTLSELYGYVRDQTVRSSSQSFIGTQHPRYDVQMEGASELVLARLPEKGAYLALEDKLAGDFVLWRGSDGHVLGEVYKDRGQTVRVLVPPGEVVVAARSGRTLRGGRFTVAEGETKTVDGEWLQDRAVAMTTSRGRPIRAEARVVWAQYGLAAGVLRNSVFMHQVGAGGRYDFGDVALFARASWGRASVDDAGLHYNLDAVDGELWVGYAWRFTGLDLVLGGGLGGGWYQQRLETGDTFDGGYLSPRGGVRLEVTALHPFSLLLGWDLGVHILQVNNQLTGRPVPLATIGAGYRLDID